MLDVLKCLLRHRSLLLTLARRDLAARYRGSLLGFLWSLVNPLLLLLVYSFAFGVIFQGGRDPSVSAYGPYALFLATGVIPWVWVQTSWLEASNSLLANAGLIRKAAFPGEILPVVAVLSNLVHFLLAIPILVVAIVVAGLVSAEATLSLRPTALLLPVVIALQFPMVVGLGLGTSALNVHFKDVRDILQNLLTLLFFVTPILYTLATVRAHRAVYWLVLANPFTPFCLAYQDLLFFGRIPAPAQWAVMVGLGLVFFAAGAWLYRRLAETLVEAV